MISQQHQVKGMKFLHLGEHYHTVVVEKPPIKRSILIQSVKEDIHGHVTVTDQPYFLMFPYVVYIIRFYYEVDKIGYYPYKFYDLRIGLSDKSITTVSDTLIRPALSNIYSCNHQVCTEKFSDVFAATLQEMVDNIIDYFWQSSFKTIGYLPQWLELTKNNGPLNEIVKFTHYDPFSIVNIEKDFRDQQAINEE